MKTKDISLWNKEASKLLENNSQPEYFFYYIGESYRRVVKMGLQMVKAKKINLLKTDLWNEGIDIERDILSVYRNDKNISLYGIDISDEVCENAKKRIKNLHVKQASIEKLPFRENYFDILLDLSTLDHIPLEKTSDAINEYSRVLKQDGVLVLAVWYRSLIDKIFHNMKDSETQYYFNLDDIKKIINNKFIVVEEYYTAILQVTPFLEKFVKYTGFHVPRPILQMLINLEYAKNFKRVTKQFGGLYVIIAKNKK